MVISFDRQFNLIEWIHVPFSGYASWSTGPVSSDHGHFYRAGLLWLDRGSRTGYNQWSEGVQDL